MPSVSEMCSETIITSKLLKWLEIRKPNKLQAASKTKMVIQPKLCNFRMITLDFQYL